jgi:glycosyltransferase involved in cell wall biosynthesis
MEINEHKIAFIYCYNDEQLLKESNLSIQSLNIPIGYEIEIIPVKNASSMCAGYNIGMQKTDAKYKVYLHQDVFIINKNFIKDILEIFEKSKKIGLIGVAGGKVIPTNGEWMEAHNKFGKVYDSHTGKMQLILFNETDNHYELVQAVDGLIMITQYDIPWREDILNGWYFYDTSQCVEFLKKGYEVIVPNQKEPWCKHDCGITTLKNGYEEYRNIFLDQYSTYLFPLVSILIPTYNRPEYLKEALESVLQQTYRNIEIIICDNSTNDNTEIMMQPFLKSIQTIRYFRNPNKLGVLTVIENFHRCFELSKGEFINFLMDDDRFSSEKISIMVNYFIQFKDITLATSYRQLINENGLFLNPIGATKKMFDIDTIIDGKELGRYVISNFLNVIGEPTTVLFRKSDLNGNFGKYLGRQYRPNADVGTWLHLLRNGRAVYIAEPLSFFRLHKGQDQNNIVNIIIGVTEWYYFITESFDDAIYVNNSNDLKEKLIAWRNSNTYIVNQVNQLVLDKSFEEKNRNLINELYKCYNDSLSIINS